MSNRNTTLALVVILVLAALVFGGVHCLQAPSQEQPEPVEILAVGSRHVDLHSSAVTTATGTAAVCEGYNTGVIQLTFSTGASATITFQGNVDESNWIAIQATNINDASTSTTSTASGLYRITTSGLQQVRANMATYISGTISAEILLVE